MWGRQSRRRTGDIEAGSSPISPSPGPWVLGRHPALGQLGALVLPAPSACRVGGGLVPDSNAPMRARATGCKPSIGSPPSRAWPADHRGRGRADVASSGASTPDTNCAPRGSRRGGGRGLLGGERPRLFPSWDAVVLMDRSGILDVDLGFPIAFGGRALSWSARIRLTQLHPPKGQHEVSKIVEPHGSTQIDIAAP
jgi:hypothetical protein